MRATGYNVDLRDLHFVLFEQLKVQDWQATNPKYADFDQDTCGAVLEEAARHGFRRVVIPAAAAESAPEGVEVIGVRTLKEALVALFS